ncbi:MAG TPA: hypothetical protein VII98_03755 [Solirubrobacteraceae bacterium]
MFGSILMRAALAAATALAVTPAAALAVPADGAFRGATAERRDVALTLSAGRVTRVRVTVGRYVCSPEGDIGPLAIDVAARARVGRRGTFGFTAGPRSERLRVDGRLGSGGLVRGRLRLTGTMGIGDPCASRPIAFSARRR